MRPLVSIIIPLYNAETYVAESIESALAQTYKPIEIIVVNDGSRDSSLEVAKKYEPYGVFVVTQENKGASAARNKAFSFAKGKYIQYLDADDRLTPRKIEEQIRLLETLDFPDDVLISGRWTKMDVPVEQMSLNQKIVWKSYEKPVDILLDYALEGCCNSPGVFLTPVNLIKKIGGWDESISLNDDGDFFSKIFSVSKKIHFCKEAIMEYRSVENSLCKRRTQEAINSQMTTVLRIINIIINSENVHKYEAAQCMAQGFLNAFYPKFKEECREMKKQINNNFPEMNLTYPQLTLKEWIYYWFVRCFPVCR